MIDYHMLQSNKQQQQHYLVISYKIQSASAKLVTSCNGLVNVRGKIKSINQAMRTSLGAHLRRINFILYHLSHHFLSHSFTPVQHLPGFLAHICLHLNILQYHLCSCWQKRWWKDMKNTQVVFLSVNWGVLLLFISLMIKVKAIKNIQCYFENQFEIGLWDFYLRLTSSQCQFCEIFRAIAVFPAPGLPSTRKQVGFEVRNFSSVWNT